MAAQEGGPLLNQDEPGVDAGELPADVRAAAEAIEASWMFRANFTPGGPLGRLHPAAVEFARLALGQAGP